MAEAASTPAKPPQPPAGRSFRFAGPPADWPCIASLLQAEQVACAPLPMHPIAARAIAEPTPLGRTLAALFGRIYIQDASSMLPPLVLNPPKGAMVLDMCSSPGSKTGLLSQLVGPSGCVLANEPNAERLGTLKRTLLETQRLNVATCRYPGQSLPLPDGMFDYIQCDPPCSGWGTVAKHPKVAQLWHGEKVAPLVGLQRLLLAEAIRLLAPGGRLVYSTCTTNQEENEDQLAWAQESLGASLLPISPPPGFQYAQPAAPFQTGDCLLVNGEEGQAQGFFVALLTKPGEREPITASPPASLPGAPVPKERIIASGGDLGQWDAAIYDFSGSCHVLPRLALERLPAGLRWQGVPVGRLTPKGMAMHPRAWGLLSAASQAPRVDAPDPASLHGLLAGRALPMPSTHSKAKAAGLWYQDLPLGWLQGKGVRALWTRR